jgi:thiol-disulfide isomerase/thioredoxin
MKRVQLVTFMAVLAVPGAHAQEAATTPEQVLERMARVVQTHQAFAVTAAIMMEVSGPRRFQDTISADYVLQRPAYMRASQESKTFHAETVNNDDGFFVHRPNSNQYKVAAAKESLAEAVGATSGMFLQSDLRFLVYLLQDDPMAAIAGQTKAMEYRGIEELDGVACHRLRLEEDELSWDVWVTDGDTPLLKRVQPDLTKLMTERAAEFGAMTISVQVDLDWRLSVAEHDFAFTAPPDTLRVAEFQAVNPQSPQFKLLAAAAPEVSGKTLAGKTAAVKGAVGDVLILDFWAIWCQPCHMLMPVLHRVAEAYADQGVRLISINVGDSASAVKTFLDEKGLHADQTFLDTDNRIAKAYGLEGLPMVVLIGKDGTVQTIRSGYFPGYEEHLRPELDKLVKGEALVARERL